MSYTTLQNTSHKSANIRLYSTDALLEMLGRVFGEEYCNSVQRVAKAKSLYKLAREAYKGSGLGQSFIVELGAHQGYGTICLCYGASDGHGTIVHTVDAYKDITGWAGEKYTKSNLDIFMMNVAEAGIRPVLHQADFISLGVSDDPLLGWNYPVSLLVWDGGNHNAAHEIDAWKRHVIVGGRIAIHDTEDGKLGSDEICASYTKVGRWGGYMRLPGGFRVIERFAE